MEAANNQNTLLKNIFSLSLLQVANNLLPILSIPVIVRIIGPENFGAINFANVVVSYFILLTNYGFDLTATRAIALNRGDVAARSRIFNEVLFSKIFLLLLSVAIFVITLYTMPQLASDKEVAIYSFLIVFSFVLTPSWLYQGMQELYNIAIFNFITKLLFTILVLFVIRQKQDYIWQPFIISVAHILVGIVAFVWAVKRYTIRLYVVSLRKVFEVLWNERVIFFSFVSVNVYTYASALILGLVDTKEAVAFFTASWRLVIIMHTIVTIPLGMSLFPFIGESFGISTEKGIDQVKRTAPFVALLTALMGISVWLLAPFIVTIFYGEAFRPSIGVLRILCFVPMVMGISNLMGVQTLVNLKMDKPYTKIIALGGVLGLIYNFWLARQASYTGAAWAWLLTEVSIAVMMWAYLYRKNIQVLDARYFSYAFIAESIRPIWLSVRQKLSKKSGQ
jgi:PST family polysaccharide transporter